MSAPDELRFGLNGTEPNWYAVHVICFDLFWRLDYHKDYIVVGSSAYAHHCVFWVIFPWQHGFMIYTWFEMWLGWEPLQPTTHCGTGFWVWVVLVINFISIMRLCVTLSNQLGDGIGAPRASVCAVRMLRYVQGIVLCDVSVHKLDFQQHIKHITLDLCIRFISNRGQYI